MPKPKNRAPAALRSPSDRKGRAAEIHRRLAVQFPEPKCALNHANPLELLVATILSAQCTDVRVNIVTKALFRRYRTAKDYAEADPEELEQLVRTTGFYRNKAKHIRLAARAIVDGFGGELPRTMEALLTLPGVARKTANVVLGTAFGLPTGVVVDTHVLRIAALLGLTREKDPEKVEADLMKLLPQSQWIDFSHRVILHGRAVCIARRPRCAECALGDVCPSRLGS
ncbi:MAG: endonuclease III [Candidatus Wallbacteria bacterium]|nr:endonuclease III [Candidatus Wallbacteria bacterium]